MRDFQLIGITDNCTTCECCGRTNLKRTLILIDSDNNVHYFGTDCAAKTLGTPTNSKKIVNEIISNLNRERLLLLSELVAKCAKAHEDFELTIFADLKKQIAQYYLDTDALVNEVRNQARIIFNK